MSNSLDPDQARHFVGPGPGPNYLQMLSTDEVGKALIVWKKMSIVIAEPANDQDSLDNGPNAIFLN